MSLRKVIAAIKSHNNFLVTCHTNPEGDAIGSELAFCNILKKLGKKATIVNEDPLPAELEFLPGKDNIKRLKVFFRKRIDFDCLVVLDCSDLNRTGEVYKLNSQGRHVLNIDHHISNQDFGDVNWVDPRASSCSEMVYRLYKELRLPMDRDTAINLYVGILTDTGSFRYSNTTSLTHKAVADLLNYDLDVPQIYKNAYENVPFEDMKLLSRILLNMKRESGGRLIWFEVGNNLLKGRKPSFDLSEYVLSFARAIKGTEVVVLFRQNLGDKAEIRVNFRSQGKVDVNKIASCFNGGGHKTASGATVRGSLDSVRRKVIAKIKEALK